MSVRPPTPRPIPPLQSGDRLTAREFLRRYRAMPECKKAELVDGEVYVGGRVSFTYHAAPHADAGGWLGTYKAYTPGVDAGSNPTIGLDRRNIPQPDAVMFIHPDCGGRVRLTPKGFLRRAPDLILEVAACEASIELHKKFDVFHRHRVREYLVWRMYDDAVDWFVNRAGRFDPLAPDPADGLLKSVAFPGLWLDAAALIGGDMPAVMAALTRGLASPEHAAFVQLLASRHTTP